MDIKDAVAALNAGNVKEAAALLEGVARKISEDVDYAVTASAADFLDALASFFWDTATNMQG